MSLPKGLDARVKEYAMIALAQMGGVATIEHISKHVHAMLAGDEREALEIEGVAKLVSARLRQTGDLGLPAAPAIDFQGTHMQLSLLGPEDYQFVIAQCLRGKRRYHKRAERYRDTCAELHGVEFDLSEIEAEIEDVA